MSGPSSTPFFKVPSGDPVLDRMQDRLVEGLKGIIGRFKGNAHSIADADYAAASSDRYIGYRQITATRSVTLPDARTFSQPELIIKDESGNASATVVIQARAQTNQSLDGTAGPTPVALISVPYGTVSLVSNGTNWFHRNQPAGTAAGDLGSTYPRPTVTATHLSAPLPIGQGGTGNTTGNPSGTAGGDLGGTYPNPTVLSVADVTTGVIKVANGGTNSSSALGNNKLMVSSGGAIVEGPANRYAALGANTAAGQSITSGSFQIVVFGTVEKDNQSGYNAATGRYTIPTGFDGDYDVTAQIEWSATFAAQTAIAINKNASTTKEFDNSAGSITTLAITAPLFGLVGGDIIDVRVFQASGASKTLLNAATTNYFAVERRLGS